MKKSGRRIRVGLLGGSFNPAHDGHLHISKEALKRLGLNQVWWLVSPQNPLKSADGMASFEKRCQSAISKANDPRIHVSDIEKRMGTRFTADTIKRLQKRFPDIRFVWLMGADNLVQIHKWRDWHKIFMNVPLAVFTRPTYDSRALSGRAASRFGRYLQPPQAARLLANQKPPAWTFLAIRRTALSATAIRASGKFPQ